jgi:hypothetical protein
MDNIPIEVRLRTSVNKAREVYCISTESESISTFECYLDRGDIPDYSNQRVLNLDEVARLMSMLLNMKIPLAAQQLISEVDFNADNFTLWIETNRLNLFVVWDAGEDQNPYIQLNELKNYIIQLLRPKDDFEMIEIMDD